ncbi:MAG: aldehyde dehydrogenase family protein [Clostridium sp.]|nr:aldehyde dehydrogenase family protein [Clostridium sp.]
MINRIKNENNTYKNLVNGEWIESKTGNFIDIHSPINNSLVGRVPAMTKEEVDIAIHSAKSAQIEWSRINLNERAAILNKSADFVQSLIEDAMDKGAKLVYGGKREINDAFYIAEKLEVGTVQVNNKTERGPDHFPFLGVKSSGIGTQGIRYSIESMSRPKAIVLNLR